MSKNTKQNQARRQNAQKSTGPKTPQGKAASSQNAVKHGLYARSIIIDSPQLKENPEEYAALLASLHEELRPEGAMQNQLVRIIADCFWRRQRVMAAETAFVTSQIDLVNPEKVSRDFIDRYEYDLDDADDVAHLKDRVERRVAILVGEESIPDGYFAQNLLRYEMRLERQLTRTYKLLRDLKKDASSRSPVIPPPIPDDAINDNGPFQGLADLEADPAVSYPGAAMLAPCSGITPSRRATPRRGRPGGFEPLEPFEAQDRSRDRDGPCPTKTIV